MGIEQYLIPDDPDYKTKHIHGANICFDCQNACGGCEWAEIDPDTGHPRFEPVPGWTAEPTKIVSGTPKHRRITYGFHITACPKFIPRGKKLGRYGVKRAVVAIAEDGEEKHFGSLSQAQRELGVHVSNISRACKESGRICSGYYWRYADEK